MSYPGYILEVPLDFRHHRDRFLGSANLISFAVSQGWYDPASGQPFNVNKVYQWGKERSPTVALIEGRLRRKTAGAKLTLREFMDTIRDPLVSGDQSGYGQVAHLRSGLAHPDLNLLWVAATGAITTPFEPYWIGTERVLPEYGKHRYLSSGEAERLVTKDFQIQEASDFAYATFKRLMYYTCDKPDKFLPEVTEALAAFENESIAGASTVELRARKLLAVHEEELARAVLTAYSSQRAQDGLVLGRALLGSIEARHRLLFGYRAPRESRMSVPQDREQEVGCAKPLPRY
jgi:dipeptidase